MPDLSIQPAPPTRALRANLAAPAANLAAPAPNTSLDQSLSGFFSQLQQSVAGNDRGTADPAPATAASAAHMPMDAKATPPNIDRQPTPTMLSLPPTVVQGAAPAGQAAPDPAGKNPVTHETAASLDQPADATPPLDPAPQLIPLPVLAIGNQGPQAQFVGAPAPAKLEHEADSAQPPVVAGKNGSKAKFAEPSSADAAAPPGAPTPAAAAATVSVAPAPPQAGASQQAVPTSSDPPPPERSTAPGPTGPSNSPEPRRTKLAAGPSALDPTSPAPTSATSTASTAPTNPATATAAATDLAAAPHVAAAPLLPPPTSPTNHAAPTAGPPPAAVQVAQAVADPVRIVLAAPPQQSDGPHVTTIQLDPVELGRVDIRIARTGDGPAKVELAAERPETLLRLIHDQPQLQQALDQAGIPQNGRTITFTLASDNGTSGAAFNNSAGNNASGSNGQRSQHGYGTPPDPATDPIAPLLSTPAWSRTGLDITA